jgi:hypothetical protein
MLSEEEKQELLDLAASPQVREEFRLLRRLSRERSIDVDELIRFLNFMARLHPASAAHRGFVTYTNVKL